MLGRLIAVTGREGQPDEQVVSCRDLDGEIARLAADGFRLDAISPADDPAVAVMSRGRSRVRLQRAGVSPPARNDRIEPATTVSSARRPMAADGTSDGRACTTATCSPIASAGA